MSVFICYQSRDIIRTGVSMKILKSVLIIVFIVLVLTGCESLSSGTSSSQIFSNYVSRVNSSNFTNSVIKKSDGILVYSLVGDFFENRLVEETMKRELEKNGFSKVVIFTDYKDITSFKEDEHMIDYIFDYGCKNTIQISFGNNGNYNTYHYGGGISEISYDIEVWNLSTFKQSIKMTDKTYSKENKFKHYDDTLDDVFESMSRQVVLELCKYSV